MILGWWQIVLRDVFTFGLSSSPVQTYGSWGQFGRVWPKLETQAGVFGAGPPGIALRWRVPYSVGGHDHQGRKSLINEMHTPDMSITVNNDLGAVSV